MPFVERDGLRYFEFELLRAAGLSQAIFTRQGGVSPAPWAALNLGSTVGDDLQRVRQNRRRALQALGLSETSVFDVWQVHSADVVHARSSRPDDQEHERADAIITDTPGLTLLMRFADCVPILLYDPGQRAIGIAHAGWQGTVRRVAQEVVLAMQHAFGTQPSELCAGIGPSIGPDHYEIGLDVAGQVQAAFGSAAADFLHIAPGERLTFDLWAANRWLLEKAGVEQIEVAGLCTVCHLQDWFSHRAEKGRTGRFGALIALQEA